MGMGPGVGTGERGDWELRWRSWGGSRSRIEVGSGRGTEREEPGPWIGVAVKRCHLAWAGGRRVELVEKHSGKQGPFFLSHQFKTSQKDEMGQVKREARWTRETH